MTEQGSTTRTEVPRAEAIARLNHQRRKTGSADPADPDVTHRLLTVLLASEW